MAGLEEHVEAVECLVSSRGRDLHMVRGFVGIDSDDVGKAIHRRGMTNEIARFALGSNLDGEMEPFTFGTVCTKVLRVG
jgi:hypothetical protein